MMSKYRVISYEFIFPYCFLLLMLSSCTSKLNYQKVKIDAPKFSYLEKRFIKDGFKSNNYFFEKKQINRIIASNLANIGFQEEANELWNKDSSDYYKNIRFDCGLIENNFDEFFRLAQKSKVVIINDANFNQNHKVFTSILLKDLFNVGYRHLALDYPANNSFVFTELNNKVAPKFSHFYYSISPSYARLIRYAQHLGYKISLFEAKSGVEGKQRWQERAKNILEYRARYTKKKEGVVVHSGYSYEKRINNEVYFPVKLANILKTKYQVDSINLEQVSPDLTLRHCKQKKESAFLSNNERQEIFIRHSKSSWADFIILKRKPLSTNYFNDDLYNLREVSSGDFSIKPPYLLASYGISDDITETIPLDVRHINKKGVTSIISLKKGAKLAVYKNKAFRAILKIE